MSMRLISIATKTALTGKRQNLARSFGECKIQDGLDEPDDPDEPDGPDEPDDPQAVRVQAIR